MFTFLFSPWIWPVLAGLLAYTVGVWIFRIYWSPLSRCPGPKLAAASLLYEGYYDIVKDGQYPWRIQEMHRQYGPVVRVNPREIHIQDPDFIEHLYTTRRDKDPWFTSSFGLDLATFATWDHNIHRHRRGAIHKFFSKASIASRSGVIRSKVLKLCSHLSASAGTGEVVHIDEGFVGLTLDVIAEFCYGVDYRYLDVPGFKHGFKATIESAFGAGAVNRQFPLLRHVMTSLPPWLVKRLVPKVAGVIHIQEMVGIEVKRILTSRGPNKIQANEADEEVSMEISHQKTVFDQILNDSKLPPEEKSEERLHQEGQSLISAGTETTARVLYLSIVHLLKQPPLLARLRQELQTVMPHPDAQPSLQQLEHLPFLTAVLKESIRHGGSAITRTSRLSPADHPITYQNWVIPPGTPVSITLFDILMDETLFPDPTIFDPTRWLTRTGSGQAEVIANAALDKYFVAFSRGPRSCAGMWLAWAELYFTVAHVHRRFDLALHDTDVSDVAAARDRFSCFAKAGNRGVRVKVLREREE